jgi:hypothetical protein
MRENQNNNNNEPLFGFSANEKRYRNRNFSERQITARTFAFTPRLPPAKDGKADAGARRVPRPQKRGTYRNSRISMSERFPSMRSANNSVIEIGVHKEPMQTKAMENGRSDIVCQSVIPTAQNRRIELQVANTRHRLVSLVLELPPRCAAPGQRGFF